MHGVYDGHGSEAVAEKIAQAEASWPEHKLQTRMIESPAYQRRRARDDMANEVEEALAWATEYLQEDVAELQFLKQHHYHPLNPETGERMPLHGCQKADKANVCKSEFPRVSWLRDTGIVLCPCQAEAHGMATQGTRA